MRHLVLLLAIFVFVGLDACKKDLLYFSSVQKIESYSDTDRLNKILFVNGRDGFIFGGKWYVEAVVLSSKDSGNSWQRKSIPNLGQLLNGATVSPTGAVYATGFEGKLLHSPDTGTSWEFFQLTHFYFRDIAFTSPTNAIVVGGISFSYGLLQYIDSAGNLSKTDSFTFQLNQIKMVSATTGYIAGFGAVLKTTDGGENWTILNVSGDNFMAMDVHGTDDIWICGNSGSIFHSTDGGYNWARLRNGNDITLISYHFMDIKFKDELNGWAVGENGLVVKSDDGGRHWMQYNQFTTNMLTSLALSPDGQLIVVGENGSIYKLGI